MTATCYVCRQPTTADRSRRVWLKDQRKERRLCEPCLVKSGRSLVPRCYSVAYMGPEAK